MCVRVRLTGVDPNPESGIGSPLRDVCTRSEVREELDLGTPSVRVFTPEELGKGGQTLTEGTGHGRVLVLFRNVSRGVLKP